MNSLCVPDTCSIIFSFKVELAGSKLIDLLNKEYTIIIPEKVKEECENKTRAEESEIKEDVDRFLVDKNEDIVSSSKYEKCLEVIQKWFNKKNMQRFNSLGEGEKHCVALVTYLNHIKRSRVLMLTDDFKASNLFQNLIDQQKIGILESVPGFLIQYYNINRTISRNHVLMALRTYFSISPNAVYEPYINERLLMSCRELGFDICNIRCMSNGI